VSRALRRYLTSTPFLSLVAAVAVAKASLGFLVVAIVGLIITPLAVSVEPSSSPGVTNFYPGGFVISGRLVDWADPLTELLKLAVISAVVVVTVRRRRIARTDCPHCLAAVLPAATVCFNCTRAID
jgi:hypothetical protein